MSFMGSLVGWIQSRNESLSLKICRQKLSKQIQKKKNEKWNTRTVRQLQKV